MHSDTSALAVNPKRDVSVPSVLEHVPISFVSSQNLTMDVSINPF